jgi:hypothetical protein
MQLNIYYLVFMIFILSANNTKEPKHGDHNAMYTVNIRATKEHAKKS